MGDRSAVPVLKSVLSERSREAIVRHEAAEALAAIADPEVLPLLREFISDPVQEVSDTCKIAVQKLEWEQSDDGKSEKDKLSMNPYASVDPAPPAAETDVDVLKKNLLDESAPLFDRYRAMFALRNKGDKESVLALAEGKTKICSQMDTRNLSSCLRGPWPAILFTKPVFWCRATGLESGMGEK